MTRLLVILLIIALLALCALSWYAALYLPASAVPLVGVLGAP